MFASVSGEAVVMEVCAGGGDVSGGSGLGGAVEDRLLSLTSRLGALILEDLAFPLRHNNALCAALPVSQAWEEGTGRLSHGSHRFLSTPPASHSLPASPAPCAPKLQTVLCPSEGKDDCTFSITAGCCRPIFGLKAER